MKRLEPTTFPLRAFWAIFYSTGLFREYYYFLRFFQQAPMGQTERAEGTSRTFYQNAEKEGVEPSIDFRLYTLSRRTH